MAGSDPTGVAEIPLIDVDALLHRVESNNDWLEKIYEQLRAANRRRAIYRLTAATAAATNRFTTTTRLFLETIIWSIDVGGAAPATVPVTLEIGSGTYVFNVTNSPLVIPFPIVVDRGVDVRGTFGTDTTADLYLIGTVE